MNPLKSFPKTPALVVLSILAPAAFPQQSTSSITVMGSVTPIATTESARTTTSLDTQAHRLSYPSPEDYLRTDSSVDIQQFAPAGVLSDISVRGASFEQTLVLVNGLRANNVETSHFNLDLPIPLATLGRTDILHGSGSTLYGSDAIGGVVNFETWKPETSALRLRSGFGSFGENEQSLLASAVQKRWSDVLAGSRDFSTGFIVDRDYRSESASNEARFSSLAGDSDILIAGDDRKFGANQFYGPYVSWERTKGWFLGATQQFNPHDSAAFGYRRHSDIYVLERNDPALYKNQHIDQSFEGSLRDQRNLSTHLALSSGLEETTDAIDSTNLGKHGRNRGAGYVAGEWSVPSRGSISAGVREELFDGGTHVTSPMLEATRWVSHTVQTHAAAGYGFRIPTFLDLYYSDPTSIGNPNLKPESAWNFEGGASWYPSARFTATGTFFYANQHNTIDYTRASEADPWRASNLPGLSFSGIEALADWQIASNQHLRINWTLLQGAQKALHGLQSEYVFNYPVNNARAEWTWSHKQVLLQSRLGVVQRFQQGPYAVWDVSAVRESGRIHPYLQMTNLTNTGYTEIVDVRMPGRGFVGGVELSLEKKR